MKAVVAAFNQEKALVGAFSVITNLRMELFEALVPPSSQCQVFGFLSPIPTVTLRVVLVTSTIPPETHVKMETGKWTNCGRGDHNGPRESHL